MSNTEILVSLADAELLFELTRRVGNLKNQELANEQDLEIRLTKLEDYYSTLTLIEKAQQNQLKNRFFVFRQMLNLPDEQLSQALNVLFEKVEMEPETGLLADCKKVMREFVTENNYFDQPQTLIKVLSDTLKGEEK